MVGRVGELAAEVVLAFLLFFVLVLLFQRDHQFFVVVHADGEIFLRHARGCQFYGVGLFVFHDVHGGSSCFGRHGPVVGEEVVEQIR